MALDTQLANKVIHKAERFL